MMEFVGAVAGVGTGFGLASLVDRIITTHAYTAATPAMDAPTQGAIYNSEAILAPIWSSWQRVAGALASIAVPLVFARMTSSHLGLKAFFQLAGFGALGRTVGKAADDGVAALMSSNTSVQRYYAGEIAATAKKNASNVAALSPAPPATFAGLPAARYGSQAVAPRETFAGAPTQRALGGFASLPGRSGMLGSSAAPDPEMTMATTVPVSVPNPPPAPSPQAPVTNQQPPVPASTSLFCPALCNPDGME